jgi:cytochrome oxidase Cu insertion factor (SCO1/SenC/PrrC family)
MDAGKKSMRIRISAVMLVVCLAGAGGLARKANLIIAQTQKKLSAKAKRYSCPMHPEVVSNKRGKCPKCGMSLRLVPDEVDSGARTNLPPVTAGDLPSISSSNIPDVRVYDQNGNQLNFYSDLVKGRTVAINFIFTTCTGVCPPMTATFRRVQQNLPEHTPPIHLISISVDPGTDTPERMHEFAAKFNAGPGWTFVTGDKDEIDLLLRALGAAVANKNDHTPMILIGNDVTDYWTRAYGLSSPTTLIQVISVAANHK